MKVLPFQIERSIIMGCSDSAYISDDANHDEPHETLIQCIIASISIDLEITAGGVTLHLAAWQDPEHWSSDWEAKGISDPYEFIDTLVVERALP